MVRVATLSGTTADTNIPIRIRLLKRPISSRVTLTAGKSTSTGLPVAWGRSSPGLLTVRITQDSTRSLQPGSGQVMIEVAW
jgi:hypothetical protein